MDNLNVPDWLGNPDADDVPVKRVSKEMLALSITRFESVFPRIMDLLVNGYTLTKAIEELPIEVDYGRFLRWIKSNPERAAAYKEAKELRTETWAGNIIKHATAEDSMEDVARSRLIVDTYKWLMASDNRRTYGDSKQIEVSGSVSITTALAQAQARIIEHELLDIDSLNQDRGHLIGNNSTSGEDND